MIPEIGSIIQQTPGARLQEVLDADAYGKNWRRLLGYEADNLKGYSVFLRSLFEPGHCTPYQSMGNVILYACPRHAAALVLDAEGRR